MWSSAPVRLIARALIAAPLVVVVLVAPGVVATGDELPPPPPPVVLIGASGLTWADIDEQLTPSLAAFMRESAIGHLSVRSVYPVTCPVDAWLTIGAARRAASERERVSEGSERESGLRCPAIPAVADQQVDGWDKLVDFNSTLTYNAELGLLGSAADATGTTLLSVGPGGALAGADDGGRVARYIGDPDDVTRSDLESSNISLLDVGEVDERTGSGSRLSQVKALDAAVADVLDVVPDDATVILLAGGNSRPTADLQVVSVRGAAFDPGLLTSASTKQEGLVLITDVTPTLFDLAGMPPAESFVGAPMTSVPRDPDATYAERQQDLVDQTRKVDVSGEVAGPFFVTITALQLGFFGWIAFGLRRGRFTGGSRDRAMAATAAVAMVASAVPAGTFLANTAPWWRWDQAHLALAVLVMLWAGAIAIGATLLGRDRDALAKVGIVAGVTAGVLTADIVTGGDLQVASLMGYSPVIAGRLYGFGNVAFALFATSLVFLAAWCGDLVTRRRGAGAASWCVLAVGSLGLVVVGVPVFGSDFGGMLALATGFGVFFLTTRGAHLTFARLLGVFAVGVVAATVVSLADWMRPPESRSHLGTFVQQVIDGELVDVLSRKLESNVDLLFSSILALLVPFVVLALAVLVLRPTRWTPAVLADMYREAPVLRPALSSWVTIMIVGFALNDSGVAIPAVGMLVAIPFLIVVAVDVDAATRRGDRNGPPADEPVRRSEATRPQ